jgi:hypothetical protein
LGETFAERGEVLAERGEVLVEPGWCLADRSGASSDSGKDVAGVTYGVDLGQPLLDVALRVDDDSDALRATRARIRRSAIGDAHRPIGVAEQREVEGELLGERFVLFWRIETDAEDRRVLRIEISLEVAEPATLLRSPRCVGFGEEPQNERLPFEVREANGVAEVILDREIGSLVANAEHIASFASWQEANAHRKK